MISGLKTGYSYSFAVSAVNFNGEGPVSSYVTFTACTSPSSLSPPTTSSTTATTLSFVWTPPSDNGGCSITSYALYLDDGNGGSFTNTDSSTIANKPYLRSHTVTLTSSDTGNNYRVYLVASNEIGSISSSLTSVLLASVPDTPASPYTDSTITNQYQIYVEYATPTSDGGSAIENYQL